MKNEPLVCICIPNYNNEKTISQTLDSILNQTYNNIIIKIFDNFSTDNSMQILKKYEKSFSNIKVFQNKLNIGGEANFTKCIEGLEGDFGAIYHADDIYHLTMVEMQVKYLIQNDISAVFVRANLIDSDSNIIGEQFFPKELETKTYHQFNFKKLFSLILKYDNFLITPSVMAKVNVYKNQIKAWKGTRFKTSADLDVWLCFSEIKPIGLITEKLISYRVSTASFSYRTKFSRLKSRDMFLVIDYYLEKYKDVVFDEVDYEYLKFKDSILIADNKILNNKSLESKNIDLPNFSVMKKIIRSNQKMKIYLYAMIIKLLLLLRLKKIVLILVKRVNKIV